MFYDAGEFCGALVLTPHDSATIQFLPHVAQLSYTAIGRHPKLQVDPDSLYSKLFPHMFIWKEKGKVKAEEVKNFAELILNFLPAAIKKYSKADFAVMLSEKALIEHKCTVSFTTIFNDATRMRSGHLGDLQFTVNGVEVFAV